MDLVTNIKIRLLAFRNFLVEAVPALSDSQLALLIAVGALILFVILTRVASRGKGGGRDGFDRTSAVLGKLEKLELTVNEFKSTTLRSIEQFKGDVGYLRTELEEIKRLIGGGGHTPEDSGPLGNDFESGGNDSGGVSSAAPAGGGSEVKAASEVGSAELIELSKDSHVAAPLAERLSKTRVGFLGRLKKLLSRKPLVDDKLFEELEAVLVEADVGVSMANKLIEGLKSDIGSGTIADEEAIRKHLKAKVRESINSHNFRPFVELRRVNGSPRIVMVVGVNGVGKTTTVAKLAHRWKNAGAKVLVVAADTFRAAAVDQLAEWGAKVGVPVVSGAPDAKPSTVVFDGMTRAKEEAFDVVVIDTAGRLHTKSNLMAELEGVKKVIERHQPDAPHECLLVVDGATGQNALSQAREFNQAVQLTGLIVTKLDGTPRGGIVVAIGEELKIPVRFIGVGESEGDLREFEPAAYVEALFDPTDVGELEEPSAHGAVRRRRRDIEGIAVL